MKDLDFKAEKAIAKDFLSNFADANGEAKYRNVLKEVSNRKIRGIEIGLDDSVDYNDLDEEFLRWVTEIPRDIIFGKAIDELVPEPKKPFPDDDNDILLTQRSEDMRDNVDGVDPLQKMPSEIKLYFEVYIRASSKGGPLPIREVKSSHTAQLVKTFVIIPCCSDVRPLTQVAVYKCEHLHRVFLFVI